MVCSATSLASPTVTIKKEDSAGVVTLKTAKKSVQHSIASLQPTDSGKYICTGENVAGVMEKDVLVAVRCKLIASFISINSCIFYLLPSQKLANISFSFDKFEGQDDCRGHMPFPRL